MTPTEKEFFDKMRTDVRDAVLEHGLENISGWRVTEKGIEVVNEVKE